VSRGDDKAVDDQGRISVSQARGAGSRTVAPHAERLRRYQGRANGGAGDTDGFIPVTNGIRS